MEIDIVRRFPHYAPHDDWYESFNKHINKLTHNERSNELAILTFLMSYDRMYWPRIEMSYPRPIEVSDCPPKVMALEADVYGLGADEQRGVQRVEVLTEVLAGKRTVASAAIRAGGEREAGWPAADPVREDGGGGLVHKGRGQSSNHRVSVGVMEYALELVKTRYGDFGPTLATEDNAFGGVQTVNIISGW